MRTIVDFETYKNIVAMCLSEYGLDCPAPDIRTIRSLTGLTRTAFCEKYGLSFNSVKAWEADPNSNHYRLCVQPTREELFKRVVYNEQLAVHKKRRCCVIYNPRVVNAAEIAKMSDIEVIDSNRMVYCSRLQAEVLCS